MKKKLKLIGLLGAALIVLDACGTSWVTQPNRQVVAGALRLLLAEAIRFLSFGGSNQIVGIVSYHCHSDSPLASLQYQMNSTRKMQKFNPSSGITS